MGNLRTSLVFEPAAVDFGEVLLHEEAQRSVQLRNVGQTSVSISGFALGAEDVFSVGALGVTTLTPGSAVEVIVGFLSRETGVFQTKLLVSVSGAAEPVALPLSAEAVAAPLVFDPPSLAFGDVVVGEMEARPVRLVNRGDHDVFVRWHAFDGVEPCSAATGPLCVDGLGDVSEAGWSVSVASGESLELTVRYRPSSTVSHAGSISVARCAACSRARLRIGGRGATAGLRCEPEPWDLGHATLGQCTSSSLRCENIGEGPVTVNDWTLAPASALADGFAIDDFAGVFTVMPGNAFTLNGRYCPAEGGERDAFVVLSNRLPSGAPDEYRLSVVASGGGLTVLDEVVDFGTVVVGQSARMRTVRVRNDSSVSRSVVMVSSDDPDFIFDGVAPVLFQPGEERLLSLLFTPNTLGRAAATLVVTADDPFAVRQTVGLLAEVVPIEMAPPLSVQILEPTAGGVIEQGSSVRFVGLVEDPLDPSSGLEVAWQSSLDGLLHRGPPVGVESSFEVPSLSPGVHSVTLTATNSRSQSATDDVLLQVCGWEGRYPFDAAPDPATWVVLGTALWDANGWLEMTDLQTNAAGAIFMTGRVIDGGNIRIRFRVATGSGSGADGFAMSVYPLGTPVGALLGDDGGALGYGRPGGCGVAGAATAYHIEFDTWHNDFDPTTSTHIAFHSDCDSENPLLWVEAPEVEDTLWHQVEVRVNAPRVEVDLDGATLFADDIPGLGAFPGVIGFSGSTGAATNHHRFDDLEIDYRCELP